MICYPKIVDLSHFTNIIVIIFNSEYLSRENPKYELTCSHYCITIIVIIIIIIDLKLKISKNKRIMIKRFTINTFRILISLIN